MRSRIDTWKRLAQLYAAVEDLRATEMQSAVSTAQKTLNAAQSEQRETIGASMEAREALIDGNQLRARIFDSTRRSAIWRRQRLEKLYLIRKELSNAAREQYLQSRIRRAQVESVVASHMEQAQIDEKCKAQMLADDRFLARRIWKANRGEQEPNRG